MYSYYILSHGMLNYEKQRMIFIVHKEAELKEKESKLVTLELCNNTLDSYKMAVNDIKDSIRKI